MKEQESLMAFEEYMAIAKYKERQAKEDDPELDAILKQQLQSNKAKMLRTRRDQEESIRSSLKAHAPSPMILLNTRDILEQRPGGTNPMIQVGKKQINLRYGPHVVDSSRKRDQCVSPLETQTPKAAPSLEPTQLAPRIFPETL